jgi:hypothetical protein
MSIPNLIKDWPFKKASVSDKLIGVGLSSVFNMAYRGRTGFSEEELKRVRKYIVLYPDILKDFYESIDSEEHLNQVFSTAKEFGIDLYSMPFWKSKIDDLTGKKNIELMSRDIWVDRGDHLLSAAKMVPGFDWESLLKTIEVYQIPCNYVRRSYSTVIKSLSETNLQKFKDYVDSTVFYPADKEVKKPGYAVRAKLYSLYVEKGLLTKKTARKIRSDGSEDSSLAGLKSLVSHSDIYSNSDELLLQFSDSRYEGVVAHLADFLPEYLLTSIMGTQFYWAKRKLEHRLERIEEAKEQAGNKLFLESTGEA